MKRHALLIGNTFGLSGVKIDISKFSRFLRSDIGGAWDNDEIEVMQNTTKYDLERKLVMINMLRYDYSIVMFSGHGGYQRATLLELNNKGETIEDSALKGLSKRQLSIFDCCRGIIHEDIKKADTLVVFGESVGIEKRQRIRDRYDERIMDAAEQQISLYSCSIGQVSYDTNEGAVYLSNFLSAASQIEGNEKLLGAAHQDAIPPTIEYSRKQKNGLQNPDAAIPKHMMAQQLIISLNTKGI